MRWWPVAAIGTGCVVVVVVLAAVLPMTAARRRLRPLANIARLTRLPEYAKVARLRSLSTIVTLVVLTVMFGAATWTAARPTAADEEFAATPAEDIMLCVGQPLADRATVELLDYFAQQTGSAPQSQRIGLTSINRRLVPLTRDHQYAVSRFGEYARAPRLQSASFAPAVPYTDYATSVEDVLALCIAGFPNFEQRGTHRRSVVYLGPSDLRVAGEQRAALFTGSAVRELAERAGVQFNVIDTAPSPKSGSLLALTEQTGGRYLAPGSVPDALDGIRAHHGSARNGAIAKADATDAPVVPLAIALFAATVLSVALMGLRR
ncbi:hypothetical protein [Mycobacterium camsae]|uniref:hypothetical protein n=1 Tax=Mycobacterium gordonae TaxID=1778 RepID=UPI001F11C582|nr:hypothetical protein [Mycobacterium gordonae]